MHTTAAEKKVLLAAGGMTAIFGSPVAAILLAIELLLFEFKPRSFIPVALSTVAAMALRVHFFGAEPMFKMPLILPASTSEILFYLIEGALMGFFSFVVTKSIYFVDDLFEKIPIHWMCCRSSSAVSCRSSSRCS